MYTIHVYNICIYSNNNIRDVNILNNEIISRLFQFSKYYLYIRK